MIKVPQEALDFIANGPEVSGVLAAPSQEAGEQMRQRRVADGMSTTQTAGEYLRSCRVAAGLGLTETAKLLDTTAVTLGEVERGKCQFANWKLYKIPGVVPGFSWEQYEKLLTPSDCFPRYFMPSEVPEHPMSAALELARDNWASAILEEQDDAKCEAIVKDEIRRILQFVVIYWEQDELMSRALAALKAWEG